MLLYLPWIKEEDLLKPYEHATEALKYKQSQLKTDSLHLQSYANDVQRLVQQLQLLDLLYDITNVVAPNTSSEHFTDEMDDCHVPVLSTCSVSSPAEDQIQQSLKVHNNMPKPPYMLMTDDDFLNCMQTLEADQMEVLKLLQDHYKRIINGHNPPPIRLFVTGGAGTGKSYLIRVICEFLNRISNKTVSTVLLLAFRSCSF